MSNDKREEVSMEQGSAAINVALGLYLDSDGETYPITNWIDADGDECEREEAVVCVAGKDNRWFSLTLADFDGIAQA